MMSRLLAAALLYLLISTSGLLRAAEPNEFFAASTRLPSGQLTLSDSLTAGSGPDTLLAIVDGNGTITQIDDDGGSGTASAINTAPTNQDSITFAVTGFGDSTFNGSHNESGPFTVSVQVFDSANNLIVDIDNDSANAPMGTLQPGGLPLTYTLQGDAAWIGGNYDVSIDNLSGGDVDFFTFTDLPAGADFELRVVEQTLPVKALVYRFTETGQFRDSNAFTNSTNDPDIVGVVPEVGELTFAITGVNDFNSVTIGPDGGHDDAGTYDLILEIETGIPADFNDSGLVDDVDLGIWQSSFGLTADADADEDGDTDGSDFLIWQRQFGDTIPPVQPVVSVPEPQNLLLLLMGLLFVLSSERMLLSAKDLSYVEVRQKLTAPKI